METKELKITIPEGQEIDWQKSAKQEKIVFKKIDNKPRSWEAYCKQHATTVTNCYFIDNDSNVRVSAWHPNVLSYRYKNTLPSKELAEAFLAMMQLMSLRQAWIGDWKPDWSSETDKWHLIAEYNKVKLCVSGQFSHVSHPLSFPTKEMALDFINCFKDLLAVAKSLI